MTTSRSDDRFNCLERPDRYDDRSESERHSEAASYAACGLALLLPPGCQHIWHAPTIRAEIADHDRRMAIGLAWMRSLDHMRSDPEAFRHYLLSPAYTQDFEEFARVYQAP